MLVATGCEILAPETNWFNIDIDKDLNECRTVAEIDNTVISKQELVFQIVLILLIFITCSSIEVCTSLIQNNKQLNKQDIRNKIPKPLLIS